MDPVRLPLRETGSLYVTRTAIYDRLANRLGGRISLFEMDDLEGLDIDTELDITIADTLLRTKNRG
jgi:N-acylneuraminate cytidylyltransferase